jgi:hypothetical protein
MMTSGTKTLFEAFQKLLALGEAGGANLRGHPLPAPQGIELILTVIDSKPALLLTPFDGVASELRPLFPVGIDGRVLPASVNEKEERQYLALLSRSSDPTYVDLFLHFCDDLAAGCLEASPSTLPSVVRKALQKWRLFWSSSNELPSEDWVKSL